MNPIDPTPPARRIRVAIAGVGALLLLPLVFGGHGAGSSRNPQTTR